MFTLPAGDLGQVQGESDSNPLCLPETVSAQAFRAFLTVLYPEYA